MKRIELLQDRQIPGDRYKDTRHQPLLRKFPLPPRRATLSEIVSRYYAFDKTKVTKGSRGVAAAMIRRRDRDESHGWGRSKKQRRSREDNAHFARHGTVLRV